jgi:hypothetical protein
MRETTLFHSRGVLVTSERVVAAGRTWELGEIERVAAVRRAPRVFPWLLALLVGWIVGVPGLLAAMSTPGAPVGEAYELVLGVAGVALFGTIVGLLSIGDTYWVVLRTRQREGRILRSRDPQLVSHLASLVESAAAAQRLSGPYEGRGAPSRSGKTRDRRSRSG